MDDKVEVTFFIPRAALVHQAAAPEVVTQHNSLHTVGLKPRQFLELIRGAPLSVISTGKTRGVLRGELLAYLTKLMDKRREPHAGPPTLAERLGLEEING